ncbi:hypothetical protein HPB47_024465 [Ixodes persulcatus]|uniref:Uncharacterized protein n=1 Tax=Ixodes persulcatus TaxID=34615 RepID=A0AC60Q4G5_IXOPE|nr:hypothetical protein HPB47_024465 [Ixodes persulcatus]
MRVHLTRNSQLLRKCLAVAEAPGTVHQSGPGYFLRSILLQPGAAVQTATTGWATISEAFADPCPTGFYSRKQLLERGHKATIANYTTYKPSEPIQETVHRGPAAQQHVNTVRRTSITLSLWRTSGHLPDTREELWCRLPGLNGELWSLAEDPVNTIRERCVSYHMNGVV